MRFHQSLEKKYNIPGSSESDFKKPPVASSLHTFLKEQSMRIQYLIQKKRDHENKLHKIETQNINKRNKLRQKIIQEQQKHAKNRKQFLEKRSKQEKFKIEEVERKRGQLMDRRKQMRKTNEETFKKMKEETRQFWATQDMKLRKSHSVQVAAAPLYEEAFYRKKSIEARHEQFGIATKEKLLTRHNSVVERVKNIVVDKLNRLQQHNEKCRADYSNYEQILQKKQNEYINKNCHLRDQSEKVEKKNKQAWEKKLKGRLIDQHDKFAKTHQNFTQFNLGRAKSMKQCRCHSKGRKSNPQTGMSESLYLSPQKKSSTAQNWYQIEYRKKDFMMQSQTNMSSVKTNQQTLKQRKDLQDQMRLMRQKQISDAIKTREQIKNDSNCLVRQARLIG